MSKIYVSGQITGIPIETAKRTFAEAAQTLARQGWEVVNPFDNGLPVEAPYEEHLAADLQLLLGCKALFALRGWQQSNGARIEVAFAKRLGIKVIYEEQMFN